MTVVNVLLGKYWLKYKKWNTTNFFNSYIERETDRQTETETERDRDRAREYIDKDIMSHTIYVVC